MLMSQLPCVVNLNAFMSSSCLVLPKSHMSTCNSFLLLSCQLAEIVIFFEEKPAEYVITTFFSPTIMYCEQRVILLHINVSRETNILIMNLMHWSCSRSVTIARKRKGSHLMYN